MTDLPQPPTPPPSQASTASEPPQRQVLYPNRYAWFILFSALDIMLTHRILNDFAHVGGRELNTLADWVIKNFGLWGAILLKTLSVLTVILICEYIGRRNPRVAGRLITGVLIAAILVPCWALAQLAWFAIRD